MKPRTRIILLSVISILIVITIVLGITYSFMQANIDSSEITEVSLSSCANITLTDTGESINLSNSYPMSKTRALETTPYTLTITSSCEDGSGYNLYLATLNTNTLSASSIHYIITEHGNQNIVVEGMLSDASDGISDFEDYDIDQLNNGISGTYGSVYRLYSSGIQYNTKVSYDLYLYIDESVTNETMGQTFVAGVAVKASDYDFATVNSVSVTEATTDSITVSVDASNGTNNIAYYYYSINNGEYVSSTNNTYTFEGLDTGTTYDIKVYVVDTNGVQSNVYIVSGETNDIPSLADVCTSGDNLASCIQTYYTTYNEGTGGLYYHDGVGTYTNADQEAGDNSYRYAGANPNNYICFGSTESPCPAENLYRIIGLFDDDKDGNYQIKLIKSDYVTSAMLGTDGRDYVGAYDGDDGSYYKGSMDTSTIAGYRWNYDTSVDIFGSNNWTTSEFNKINLNTNYWNYLGTTWQNLIAETTWHLGAMSSSSTTAKAFYDGERNNAGYESNPTTYTDEIGLMYVSDYGYAADPSYWTTQMYREDGQDYRLATTSNWMYMGLSEWTLTPHSSTLYYVFLVYGNGYVGVNIGFLINPNASGGYSARPVFYLESNVQLEGGSGTSSDPYRLAV